MLHHQQTSGGNGFWGSLRPVAVGAMCVAAVVLPGSGSARAACAVFEDNFESYTSGQELNASGPWNSVTVGNPDGSYSWARQLSVRETNNVYPGDGSEIVPVSPFAGGDQMLEFWDSFASPGRYLNAAGDFAIGSTSYYPLTVAFDYRVDSTWTTFGGTWRMTINKDGGSTSNGYFIELVNNVDTGAGTFDIKYIPGSGTQTLITTLDTGVWYHVELKLDAPISADNQPATMSIWEWTDGAGSATKLGDYAFTGRKGFDELNRISIGDVGSSPRGHWYFDNLSIWPHATWTGASGTDWNAPGNWHTEVPDSGDSAFLCATDQDYTVDYDAPMAAANFGLLTISNAGAFTTTLNINAGGFDSTGADHLTQGVNSRIIVGSGGDAEFTSTVPASSSLSMQGEFTVNGGTAVLKQANSSTLSGSGAVVTVNSGTFTTEPSAGGNAYNKVLRVQNGANLNINGGTTNLTGNATIGRQGQGSGTLTMTDGALNLSQLRETNLVVGGGDYQGTVTVSGGDVNNYGGVVVGQDRYTGSGGSMTLSGGAWTQMEDGGGVSDVVVGYRRGSVSTAVLSVTGGQFNTAGLTLLGKASTYDATDGAEGHLIIDGGTYNAVDSVNNDGTLNIRRGKLTMSSGALNVDILQSNNLGSSISEIVFDGGTLTVNQSSDINNTATLQVGNGTDSASLILNGASNSFADGLQVNNNAMLSGGGTITGTVTIASGGTLSPGN